jgi:hypothetical protein
LAVFDTKLSGFGYRLTPAGTGIYFVGKPRRNFAVRGSMSPADARELARQMLADLAGGKDPIAERRARQQAITAGAMTVAQLADRWMADYVRPKLKPRTIADYEQLLAKHILVSLQMIGKLLGHKVPATTQRYAHLARDAAAAVNAELGAAMTAAIEKGKAPATGTVVKLRRPRRGQ